MKANEESHPRFALGGLLLAGLASVLLSACGSDAAEHGAMPPAPAVSVAAAVAREVHASDEFTGRVEAPLGRSLRTRPAGG